MHRLSGMNTRNEQEPASSKASSVAEEPQAATMKDLAGNFPPGQRSILTSSM
jgi:hypothetical protein